MNPENLKPPAPPIMETTVAFSTGSTLSAERNPNSDRAHCGKADTDCRLPSSGAKPVAKSWPKEHEPLATRFSVRTRGNQ